MHIMPISNNMVNTNFGNRAVKNVIRNVEHEKGQYTKNAVIVLASVVLAGQGVKKAVKKDDFVIRELSPKELKQKTKEIAKAKEKDYEEWTNLRSYYDEKGISYSEWKKPTFAFIDIQKINQWNAQLFDYMLKHPEYKYNYTDLAEYIEELGTNNNNSKSADVALKMLKMNFLFPKAYNSKGHLGLNYHLLENADTKMKILDMIDKNKTNYNRTQILNLRDILIWTTTKDGLTVAKKFIEKPEILKSNIHVNAFRYFLNEKGDADIKIAMIDKINSKPELLKDKNFMNCVPAFINNVIDKPTLDFASKLIDNPILFKSESFCKALNNMIYEYPTGKSGISQKTRDVMYQIVDAAAQKPELFENEKFNSEFGELLFVRRGPQGEIWLNERPIEIGKRNLFLIENGYYDTQNAG